MKDLLIEMLFDIPDILMLLEFFRKKRKIIYSILESFIFVFVFSVIIVFAEYDVECIFSIVKVLLILILSIIQWRITK